MKTKREVKDIIDNLQVGDTILEYTIDEIDKAGLYTVSSPDFEYSYKWYEELFDEVMENEQDLESNSYKDGNK